MSYTRFSLMIAASTVTMFVLMYLNTYAWEHVFFSETRLYMALVMGATMAVIMLAFMLGMYTNRALNIAIFAGAVIAFGAFLWLVRAQATVSGTSYMRAMIPHHSIAVMTSERAGIEDARVRKLADEIIAAQRREIAEMRYLIADIDAGNLVRDIAGTPPPEAGSVADAIARVRVPTLDLEPLGRDAAGRVLPQDGGCRFNTSPETEPVLWTSGDGAQGAVMVNNTVIALSGDGGTFAAEGISVRVSELGDEGDWRSDAALVATIGPDFEVGYRGFWRCG
ncbi:protein of unknown function [Lutimaribacter pacificus]|uniref:DUF305 domain-containing protein n=1 Tax=Lutimaribacter pacificus TaxID=391948 RepID=A0A1H0M6V7_9RHOB|nr:DUF305 domain-containing protein [Lutimaribacter pacificus]SDO76199.1 protein of unknown function [Lutimaribacter pacificus]SHK78514.1 protein of unknown function [Lutimaribacter pacificus]